MPTVEVAAAIATGAPTPAEGEFKVTRVFARVFLASRRELAINCLSGHCSGERTVKRLAILLGQPATSRLATQLDLYSAHSSQRDDHLLVGATVQSKRQTKRGANNESRRVQKDTRTLTRSTATVLSFFPAHQSTPTVAGSLPLATSGRWQAVSYQVCAPPLRSAGYPDVLSGRNSHRHCSTNSTNSNNNSPRAHGLHQRPIQVHFRSG